jgi:hypothetical protein
MLVRDDDEVHRTWVNGIWSLIAPLAAKLFRSPKSRRRKKSRIHSDTVE